MTVDRWRTARVLLHLWRWDLFAQTVGTRAGLWWNLIAPAVVLCVYAIVFELAPAIRFAAEGPSYGAGMIAGLVPWLFFQEAVSRGASAMVDQRPVLTQVPVPPALFPIATTLTAWARHLGALVLLFALLAASGHPPGAGALLLVIPMVPLVMLAFGVSALLATATVWQRDVAPTTAAAMLPLFFATPVLYPMHVLPQSLRLWVDLNPLTPIVLAYRAYSTGLGHADTAGLVFSTAVGLCFAGFATVVLRRAQGRVAERL